MEKPKTCPIRVREANRGNALQIVQGGNGKPVLIQFYADWCGHCQEVRPEVDKASRELCGEVDVVRVNVDRHSAIADKAGIKGLPTMLVVQDGQVLARSVGAESAEDIVKLARRGLAKANGVKPVRAQRAKR
jgi:thioredoxin 1